MVPNKNKKYVDNDVLIKFAILSDSDILINLKVSKTALW